ncbi:MAG: insulinase family protein [Aquificae bacterium]|nr:insulinase family protein [Aquificota bacterium]
MLKRFLLGVAFMTTGLLAGELFIREFENGAKLIVKPRTDTEAVALQVWFRVGSVYEKYDEKGMAHFLEHLLFHQTEKYGPGEVDRVIESLGGQINAGTSKDYTYYHVEIAHPYWRQGAEVLYQITMRPKITKESVEKEKEIVIEEIRRAKDSPTYVLWEEFEKLVYKVSPYRFPVLGFEETVRKFTLEKVLNFYRSYYQPKNMAFVVVGKVKPEEVERFFAETFGKEEGWPVPKVKIPTEPPQKSVRFKKLEDPRLERAYWVIGWRVPPAGSKEHHALLVLSELLCGGRISLLYQQMKEKGLVYAVWCGDLARPRDNLFVVEATFEPKLYDEVKEKLFELLNELYRSVTDEQVKEAVERILGSRLFAEEKAESEAFEIGYAYTVLKDLDLYRFFDKNLRRVRKVDVLRLFERYLLDKPYSEVLMLPQGSSRSASDHIHSSP